MDQAVWMQSSTQTNQGIVVASCNLADLFSGKAIKASDGSVIKGQLHLPEYQRPYRWKRSEIERLLNDLKHYFEPDRDTKQLCHKFYLGSVILHQNDGEHLLNIIDGQQRITSMGLLSWCLNKDGGNHPAVNLEFHAPESQSQIYQNIKWLLEQSIPKIDFKKINITLVVTRSEDDAYRFFETQNTGGVRLSGPDIIKAHHLRAIDRNQQNHFARLWERLGDLNPVVNALIRARYWRALDYRPVPSRLEPHFMRLSIVKELAEKTGKSSEDLAYRPLTITRSKSGNILQSLDMDGYAARQPLNAGVNTVHYLEYFEVLRKSFIHNHLDNSNQSFNEFYCEIICNVEGCAYIKELYDSCLLVYLSHFGSEKLYEAALWLFRVVYSIRVTNLKMVKEMSIGAFVRDNPVYDWMLMSYSHEECIEKLKPFSIEVSSDNLEEDINSVKKRFVQKINAWFGLGIQADKLAELYDEKLIDGIRKSIELSRGGV